MEFTRNQLKQILVQEYMKTMKKQKEETKQQQRAELKISSIRGLNPSFGRMDF